MQNEIPNRKPDFVLDIRGEIQVPGWNDLGNVVFSIIMKDGQRLTYSEMGSFNEFSNPRIENIKYAIIYGMAKSNYARIASI